MVTVRDGRVTQIAYTIIMKPVDTIKSNIPVIFRGLVERFGSPQDRFVVEHLRKGQNKSPFVPLGGR